MENNNIDILGLAETSLNANTSKIFAKSISDCYVLYSSEGEKKGLGVGFLIKKEYDKYVQSFQHFNNHYIWVNADTLISTFDSKILDVNPSIKTDHHIIYIELLYEELFYTKTDPKLRKNPSRTIYSYKNMKAEEGEWNRKNYNKDITDALENTSIKLTPNQIRDIQSIAELNQRWNQFQNVILNSAKKNIKNRLSKKPAKRHHSVRDSQLHHDITTLKGMITKSKNTNVDFDDRSANGIKKIIEFTTRKHTHHDGSINDNRTELSTIMSRHNIAYTNNNIRNKTSNFLHKLQSTLATLEAKFYHEYYEYHKWLIESFVDERNDNYKNDKKKMINSITEKHIKSITINKVYCNDNDEDILYTDVQDVQEQTNLHFQRVAGAINTEKNMNDHPDWIRQYTPQDHINDIIYTDLLNYPTLEDWIETINNLPNDKASGPSGISYEMLKYFNIINQSIFHAFICVCIDLGTIPDA
ncbi:hypothetical protein RclHR1_26290002 [Rhizophagus clarus]|uniref:Reverse transcriptase domain-containing protein n=1 Tax=Rhizophagus clarus TaxID=94130 RepID=A0A2Z6R4Q4_9GLOM|nr:hypothetical protein RclHR1_26290002 [Rhizophagus clarus]